ncbi:MAG: pyruvate formate lyase family protein [Desulfatibacillaceae bacterium]
MSATPAENAFGIKEPRGLSERVKWLRDYFFLGESRAWNNEFTAWTTGVPWDVVYNETDYYIVPETYAFMPAFTQSFKQAARTVPVPGDFFEWSIAERRAWFVKETMVNHVPGEILPGDLLCGARFNIQASRCWNKSEAGQRASMVEGRHGNRAAVKQFHDRGYGNAGPTSGHLICDYPGILRDGFSRMHADLSHRYERLGKKERRGARGAQLRAMMTAATMPRDLAEKYAAECRKHAAREKDPARRKELMAMAANCDRVPWRPPRTFWEAVQALWFTHMLVMADECYPGPGVSFGRIDQYLLPFWQRSIRDGMDPEFGKEILKCFWIHANTAYDAMVRTGGNGGITAGYGQLITLSGMGAGGEDMTNELTWVFLEVIDEMSPILEPKPNVRLHKNSPDDLLDRLVDMVAESQGAPFLLNFDERSMAGMMREARRARVTHLINEHNVHEYAPVGCLENTMCGNDRSGTVDINLNLLKAVELALGRGRDILPYTDPVMGKKYRVTQDGPRTPDPGAMRNFEQFWEAFAAQMRHIVGRAVELYERGEKERMLYRPTPYVSCLVRGCAEQALDVTQGGAELSFVTLEAVTFATTVDSLLAIRYLVFDEKACTMDQLLQALRDNWRGHEPLQARARFRAPKYGRDDDEADAMALRVMELWTEECWNHVVTCTNRQVRPGMLSWNYWVGDGYVLPASPDGRPRGRFLSNAICPTNGADIHGPTSNANSVGKALGGRREDGCDYGTWCNMLPNGASHTITFSPSLARDPEHKARFKAFLRAYVENGGTALQINMVDPGMLKDAQKHPENYRHLLVRVTGYNAYFTSIGRELQDELIARLSHDL